LHHIPDAGLANPQEDRRMDLINRRQFVAASASALMLGAPQLAQAQAKPKLRFSAAFPETDLRAEAYKAFAAAMKDDFDFEPYWANTLFKQGTELVALQRDNLEVCNLAPADISKQIPAWSLLTSAYLFRDYDHLKKTFASDVGQDFIKMARDQVGIEVIRPVYFGARQLNLKPTKKINTPADMAGIKSSGIPYLLVHFALGKSISEGREFDLDYRSRRLLDSLRDIAGVEIHKTGDFVSLSRGDALKMCRAPFDCHPSEFGMEVYADAVSKMVRKSGLR
jgi:hypothetical protein